MTQERPAPHQGASDSKAGGRGSARRPSRSSPAPQCLCQGTSRFRATGPHGGGGGQLLSQECEAGRQRAANPSMNPRSPAARQELKPRHNTPSPRGHCPTGTAGTTAPGSPSRTELRVQLGSRGRRPPSLGSPSRRCPGQAASTPHGPPSPQPYSRTPAALAKTMRSSSGTETPLCCPVSGPLGFTAPPPSPLPEEPCTLCPGLCFQGGGPRAGHTAQRVPVVSRTLTSRQGVLSWSP